MKELKELVGSALTTYGHKTDEELKELGFIRPKQVLDVSTKQYWDKLRDFKPIEWSDEHRKRVIKRKLHKMAGKAGYDKFSPTEQQAGFMKMLYSFLKEEDTGFNIKKGLVVIGSVGVGKTSIMSAFLSVPFKPFIDDEWYNTKPKFSSCIDVVDYYNEVNSSKVWVNWKEKYNGDIYLSDLGTEHKPKYATSDSEPIIGELIEYRDNRPTGKTFFCTNLSEEDLLEKYGKRVYSRLRGHCNFINLNDLGVVKDFRI